MFLFPQPFDWQADSKVSAVFLFFEMEWFVFLGSIFSNIVFIVLRTLCHSKIQLDNIPQRKQLPDIDTVLAISEVANAFTC